MELALDQVARVKAVAAGSIAEKAGLRPGDDIVNLDGQPLISIADVSWLYYSPLTPYIASNMTSITCSVSRARVSELGAP